MCLSPRVFLRSAIYFSAIAYKKALVFCPAALKACTSFMMIRFAIIPLLLALNFSMCKRHESAANGSQSATSSPAAAAVSPAAAPATSPPKINKAVVDQTAQTIIFCYHRLVDKIRYPATEITPADSDAQMQQR